MPIQKNLNVSPYYDDFDVNDNYYRVLYKAGYPIQARELTQQQSILQDQIEQFASRILTEGDNVVPGEYSFTPSAAYVRLSSFTRGTNIQDFVGKTVLGASSGVRAIVNFAIEKTEDDDDTLYVTYTDSGNDAASLSFAQGEIIEVQGGDQITAVVGVDGISKPTSSNATGLGSLFTVSEGSYFIGGTIIRNKEQTIAISKYDDRPDAVVGFVVNEEIVTSNEDPSLLDNSQGSSNFAAPGADRLKITLDLASVAPGTNNANFITLCTIQQGNVLNRPGNTVKWDWLYELLARRTFDESGDYIVKDFPVNVLEYANTADQDGVFEVDPNTGLYPAWAIDSNSDGFTYQESEKYYAIHMSPGKAYVRGYEIEYTGPVYIYKSKTRDANFRDNTITQVPDGYSLPLTNMYGGPDVMNISGDGNANAFDDITLYRNFIDGFVGAGLDGNGRPLNMGNAPWTTYHIIADGDIGSDVTGFNEIYKEGNSAVVSTNIELVRGSAIGNATALVVTKITPSRTGILRPRFVRPQTLVPDGNFYSFNSTYKLGILDAVYFTEIDVVGITNPEMDWTVGQLAVGEKSGAAGVIEEGSTPDQLILSLVKGEFELGEEITQGDKVSRIYRDGEISSFKFTDKGATSTTVDLSSETEITLSALGLELTLTVANSEISVSASGITLLDAGREKLKSFPYPEGSDLNTRINYEVVTAPNAVNGYAVTRVASFTNTASRTKSLFSFLEDTNDFSADISIQNTADSEIIDVAASSLFSADAGTNILSCDNFSGDASAQLRQGDLITFVDDSGRNINCIVDFTTKPVGYGEQRSNSKIYLTTTVPNNVTGKTIQRIRVRSAGQQGTNLLMKLPHNTVKTLETNSSTTSINYQVYREFILNASAGASTVTLSSNKNNETFLPDLNKTIICVSKNLTNSLDPNGLEGRTLTTSSIDASQDSGRKIVYTLTSPLSASVTLKIFAPVYVTDAHAKRKIFRDNQTVTISQADAASKVISLGKADVYEVYAIDQNGIDITDNFNFDNGQRDNSYQISRITRKDGRPIPAGDLEIAFSYFEHTGDGDFFSVDSYTDDDGIGYRDIPTYMSTVDQPKEYYSQKKKDPKQMYLRDCIDFRPIVNTDENTGSDLAFQAGGVDVQGATNYLDSSVGGNGFVPRMPIPSTPFQCDLEYYLGRVDSLFLSDAGDTVLITGDSADKPRPPAAPPNSIRLYDFRLPPYTFDVKDIWVEKFTYRRYRMQDIASIDRQLQNLTQVVSLTLLEQDAINTDVRDAVTGLDRFKNGIVVDPFNSHSRGDYSREDYRCAIDSENTHLRAPFYSDQIEMREVNSTNQQRSGDGYVVNNGIATVSYDEEMFIEQPNATKWINCQPYFVWMWRGNMELHPPIDTWTDTHQLPDLIVEDDSLYQALEAIFEASGGEWRTGVDWGEWQQTATNTVVTNGGNSTTTTTTTQFERSGTQEVITIGQDEQWLHTSLGDRVINTSVAETCRSIPVNFVVQGLKPNTRIYMFFDGVPVSEWCAPDIVIPGTEYSDGLSRYDDTVASRPGNFSDPIITDDIGTAQGVFILPNGRAPLAGSAWTGDFADVEYETEGSTRSFNTGTRRVMLNSDSLGRIDEQIVEAVAETNFVSSGLIQDVEQTILATRMVEVNSVTETVTDQRTETRVTVVPNPPAVVRSGGGGRPIGRTGGAGFGFAGRTGGGRNGRDPVAQTFAIDEVYEDGVFVTSVDVYFRTKDSSAGIRCYMTDTIEETPTINIIPHSDVMRTPDTILRVVATLGEGISSEVWEEGMTVVGQTSGATGIIKSTMTFSDSTTNPDINVTNKVYDVILSNYLNDFVEGEVIVPQVTPASTSNFAIVTQQYKVETVDVKRTGSGYTTASVEFSAPQLPGGITATADATVFDGLVYDIKVTNPGSGYTQVPTVTISGDGVGATAEVFSRDGNPGVYMGIATSDDASAPTRFHFKAPIYLRGNNTVYSFVLLPPASLDYNVWVTRIGENDILTGELVSTQASLGSLFMSQNGGIWSADQNQDIKFRLQRAKFAVNQPATLGMQNKPLKQIAVGTDPIETNHLGTDLTSEIFGDNPKIIRVYSQFNGLSKGDLTSISGVVNNPGGIPNEEINGVHRVVNSDINLFTIEVQTAATSSTKDGGSTVKVCPNRPYEVLNLYGAAVNFSSGKITLSTTTTEARAMTGYNEGNKYRLDSPQQMNLQENYYFTGPKQVASYLNEADNHELMDDERSLQISAMMVTFSDETSPVLDLTRTNSTIIRSLIDDPGTQDEIFGIKAQTLTFGGDISGAGISVGNSIEFNDEGTNRDVVVRQINNATGKIQVGGQYADKINVDTTFTNPTLNSAGLTSVVPLTVNDFVPETENNGSVFAKWMSRMYNFEFPCDGVELKLAAIFYDLNDIKVYYRPLAVGFDGDVSEINWIPFNGDGSPNNSDRIVARGVTDPNPSEILSSEWQSLTWSIQDVAKFNGIAIKIVMTAQNPALVPLIDDLQMIVTE